jgi:uncharacterized protein (DUF305 family)
MNRLAAATLLLVLGGLPVRADDAPPDPATRECMAEDSMLGMLTMKPGAEASEADRGYMKAMQATQQTLMKTEMSGSSGGDFLRVMIPHHQSAIDMIDVMLAQKDVAPEIRKMAEAMRAAQAKEIVEMQGWLERQGQ